MTQADRLNSVGFSAVNAASLRARLKGMDIDALRRFGQASAYMCSEEANLGKEPREVFVFQLKEARAEWKRRRLEGEITE